MNIKQYFYYFTFYYILQMYDSLFNKNIEKSFKRKIGELSKL